MTTRLSTHLTLLEDCFASKPDTPAFHLPQLDASGGSVVSWTTISYAEFRNAVVAQALYWSGQLKHRKIYPGAVVTLWTSGLEYEDAALIFGLSRAGYTLELVSFAITTIEALYDMAQRAGAQLLIYNSSREELIAKSPCHVPVLPCYDSKHRAGIRGYGPPSDLDIAKLPSLSDLSANPDAMTFILHTTGSTSGTPKLVPWTYRWIDNNLRKINASALAFPHDSGTNKKQFVSTWLGTICHAGQLLIALRVLATASCVIQPRVLAFSSSELKDMAHRFSLTTLNQFPSLFSTHLAQAKNDPELLRLLQSLDRCLIVGMALSQADNDWCMEKGIKLEFVFASTEAGVLLRTAHGKPYTFYERTKGSSFVFSPVPEDPTTTENTQRPRKLLELIIPADSLDCPVAALCSPLDGDFHTGDLFEEVEPGFFESRGRADDWIKLRNGCRCDTRAVENNILRTCRGLVQHCVATGSSRPFIVIFVEHSQDLTNPRTESFNEVTLKKEILARLAPVQTKMWAHEMILHLHQIQLVPENSLPRTSTKGNIRRAAVEEIFGARLDALYREISAESQRL